MKITFEKNELVRGVTTVQKAVSSKTTLEILQCILIDAQGNTVFFVGTKRFQKNILVITFTKKGRLYTSLHYLC